jgi:hypothetical protein
VNARLGEGRVRSTVRDGRDTGPNGASSPGLEEGAEPVAGYRLARRIARGGFGEVWEARGPGGFPAALKFVALGGAAGKVEAAALERVKGLRHPHLLALFGAWRTERWLVVASELADRSLADGLQDYQAQGLPGVPGPELMRYLRDCAECLDYLNVLGVQHRDVKPHNLLLVGGGVKIGDLGLVKLLQGAQASHTGLMTPAYAAPEFFAGRTSRHSDQYSLAVSYCELRGGRLPFTGSAAEIMHGHLQGQPDLSMLPECERPAVARALTKNPEERWPSCAAFAEQVAAAKAPPPPAAASWARVEVTVANRTGHRLVRDRFAASSGAYAVEPPPVVADGEAGSFCVESKGLLTGAAGSVSYRLEGHGGACEFEYAVPLLWPNRYSSRCPEGFRVERSGGGGYAAQVQFVATRAGQTAAGKDMSLRDAFYALVLDEIRCQPGLAGELGGNELAGVALAAFGHGLQWVCEQIEQAHTGLPRTVITGPGFDVVRSLLPPPASLLRPVAEVLSIAFGSNYDALCRSALLHLFWGQLDAAERKVNLAKHDQDGRAFAHHVYGLLRGLQQDREGARFELGLALAREGFEGPRQRVRRAMQLVA